MNPGLKNKVFYIVIAGDDRTDHVFLRRAMNKLVPQAIVESFYESDETVVFLKNHRQHPHLIFLDQNMLNSGVDGMMKLIRNTEGLKEVPVIILTDKTKSFTTQDLQNSGANEFYSKPYHVKALDHIVNEVREKWFVSVAGKAS
jgi:response regulator RpfG family c-di-GMP phosphodiesterase